MMSTSVRNYRHCFIDFYKEPYDFIALLPGHRREA